MGDGDIEVLVQDVLKQVLVADEKPFNEDEYDEDLASDLNLAIALSKSTQPKPKRKPRVRRGMTSKKNVIQPMPMNAEKGRSKVLSARSLPQAVPSPRPQRLGQPPPVVGQSNIEVVERNKQLARAILARKKQTTSKKLRKGTGHRVSQQPRNPTLRAASNATARQRLEV